MNTRGLKLGLRLEVFLKGPGPARPGLDVQGSARDQIFRARVRPITSIMACLFVFICKKHTTYLGMRCVYVPTYYYNVTNSTHKYLY